MTLEGAKFICLDEAGNHGEVVLAKGRKFTMGYYVTCDYVLVDERAKGVHCEIECDAFGRVTIRNLSPNKPILVNGSAVEIKRILLNNSKLSILDKEYLWLFSKNSSNEFEDVPIQDLSTPQKLIGIPEQPPNSCPDFKLHRDLPKRFTVHNFVYCIQSDEEGNTSSESNNEYDNKNGETSKSQVEKKSELHTSQLMEKDSKDETSQENNSDIEKENRNRCITPDPNEQVIKLTTEPFETPKMNLINCTKDKENSSTENKHMHILKMCHQSDIVITSFSPRETGVKVCKSFATVIKPKVLVTKPPTSPKSVYSTPTSDMNQKGQDAFNQSDLIAFYTPSTSKKVTGGGGATALPTSSIKVLTNSSMHLIDLTTPTKLKPASPYLKSNLIAAKKNLSLNVDKSCTKKLSSEEQLGLMSLTATPATTNVGNTPLKTPSSVISIDSSVENSSIIEVTSDGSNIGVTPSIPTALNTPLKLPTRVGACTPKRTPQSLMKRAILTSAKKQNKTPLINTQNPATPHRDSINRIPLRSNIVLSKTPVTPKVLTGSSGRHSMNTPIRQSAIRKHFDHSPSTSNILSYSSPTSATKSSRRSSLNPISAAKALPTSTPVSGKSVRQIYCRTSPLHKVRKSYGGIPLSSHISRSRKSTVLSTSISKVTSIKEKSPQQVMSDRLVNRARKSIFNRSHNLVEAAKTPPQSSSRSSNHEEKANVLATTTTPERKAGLFTDKNTEDENEADVLSGTFILDSREDENVVVRKDATFSPEKIPAEKVNIADKKEEPQAIEVPVDAEEVIDLCNDNKENTNQTNNEENNIVEACHEAKDDNLKNETDNAADANRIKTIVSEESFAEEISASLKQTSSHPIIDSTQSAKSLETQQQTCLAVIKNDKDATYEIVQDTSIKNDQDNRNVAETGFGEESSVEVSQRSPSKMCLNKESQIIIDSQSSQPEMLEGETVNEYEKVLPTSAEKEIKSTVAQVDQASKIKTKADAQNLDEYQPIVEDITLEGSSIEKEKVQDNSNTQLNKDIDLKDSLLEEKVISEATKEESDDKEQVISVRSKNNEMSTSSEIFQQTNTDIANIILTTEEISTKTQQEGEAFAAESEIVEKSLSNPIDVEFVNTNQNAKNVEVKNKTTNTSQENGSEPKNLQVSQPEPSKVVKVAEKEPETVAKLKFTMNYENKIEENLEDTNKLLEEIEDVLNKSDEIKQKQLNELEQSSDKPLTEELESEQFSPEEEQEISEFKETGNLVQNSQKQTDHVAEFSSSSGPSSYKTTNETTKKPTPADIVVCQTSNVNATNSDLNPNEIQANLQNKTVDENISERIESNDGVISAANTERNDTISGVEVLDSKSLENESTIAINSNETVDKNSSKQSESNDGDMAAENAERNGKISDVQVLDSKSLENESTATMKANIETEMDGNSEQMKVLNKNEENISNFTPRRSTRRASQSSDAVAITSELTFTPRRSTRRSSMSSETLTTATAFTPTKRTSRRASLSTVNDTPLTPKPITKRRVSISLDDETVRPGTSKLQQRAKTPRKQLDLSMIIPEENDEICIVIKEDEEEEKHERMRLEEVKKDAAHDKKVIGIETETAQCAESEKSNKSETVLELNTISQKDLTETTTIPTEEATEAALECNIGQAPFEDSLGRSQLEVLPTNLEESSACNTTMDEEDQCKELPPIKQTETTKNEDIISAEENLSEFQHSKALTETSKESITTEQSIDDDNMISATSPDVLEDLVCSPNISAVKEELEVVIDTPNLEAIVSETLNTEVSPKNTKKVTILGDSPKTPLMTGVRELLKTPKPATQTPRFAGIRKLIRTPKDHEENETEEMEKLTALSDLVKTPEISTPKVKKHVTIAAESPKTPLFTGLPQLLKTPKSEPTTPKFAGVRDLMKTPKSSSENEQEEVDKLATMTVLLKTPECSRVNEETSSSSMKGVKELLQTPKHLNTPQFKGMRELLKTPKVKDTPNTTGVKELLESPVAQTREVIPVSPDEIDDTKMLPEDLPSFTSQTETGLKEIKELLKTPKSCSTPRRTGLRELMNTPQTSSTPALSDIKGLLGDTTTVQLKDNELEKFLRTPTAKNIMISSMPSSAVIEKGGDSIEISTEYDLNATNEPQTANLGELFKTPGATCFEERTTDSYSEERTGREETLQDKLNKTAEEAFDKLIGQESQIQTPIRKRYARKSFSLQTPTCSSPFTAAEILSDLPKTDVEEWIESLDQAQPPTLIECEDDEAAETNEEADECTINTFENSSIEKKQSQTLNESIIPETCAKIFITEKSVQGNKSSASSTYVDTKDPLLNTYTEFKEALSPVTLTDAEISGINLLDQTIESVQNESSMLDAPLFVDEPSMFDEPLIVSDYESEGERSLNFSANIETSQEEGNNDLSEPLLVSDSENLSQDSDINNKTVEKEHPATETKHNTSNQEKSMLEISSSKIELLADDPLETEDNKTVAVEQNTVIEMDLTQNDEANCLDKSLANDTLPLLNKEESAISSKEDQKSFAEIILPQESNETLNHLPVNTDIIIQESSKKQESKVTEVSEISSTSQIDTNDNEFTFNADISSTTEIIDAELDAAETLSDPTVHEDNLAKSPTENIESTAVAIEQMKIVSTESENVIVDTSATDICEETHTLTEEEAEIRQIEQKMCQKKADDECQDIFMDNSNIDESFAHEALNDDNNAALNVTITKTSIEEQDVLRYTEIEQENENETDAGNQTTAGTDPETDVLTVEVSNEAALSNHSVNETDSKAYDSNLVDIEQSNTVFVHSVNSQSDTKSSKITQIENIILDKTSLESTVVETISEIEPLMKEIVASQSIQINYAEEKHYKTESGTTTPIQEPTDTVTETVYPDTTPPDTRLNEDEGELESSSQIADKTVAKTTSANVISESSEESLVEHDNTNELFSTPVEDFGSVESIDVKNKDNFKSEENKSNETIATNCSESVEQSIEINITTQTDDSLVNVENDIGDVTSRREAISYISAKNTQTSENTGRETEIQSGTDFQEDVEKDHINKPPTSYKETVAAEEVTSQGRAEPTIEVSMQKISSIERVTKSTSEERTFLEESINTTTEIVKYDFEIKINERHTLEKGEVKLEEVATTSSLVECPQTNEFMHEIIPNTDEQSHKTNANVEYSPDESPDIANVFEDMSQEDVEKGQRKSIVTDDCQESTEGGEMSKSSRRDRHKVSKTPANEKPVEIVENAICDIKKEDERSKSKRTTSESSLGSITDNDAGCTTKTRRGGRRKIQKTSQEPILGEQQVEEIVLLKQLENKTYKTANPTETRTERKESAHTTDVEIINEQNNDIITTKEEKTPEQEQASSNSEKIICESNKQGAENTIAEAQNASTEPLVEKLSVSVAEKRNEISNETPPGLLQDQQFLEEKPGSQALPDEQSVDNKTPHKFKLSNEIEAPEQTISAVTTQEEILKETDQLRSRNKPTLSESSQGVVHQKKNTRTRRNISKVQVKTVGVNLVEEDCQTEKILTESAPSHSEELKLEERTTHKRNRCNATLSESSLDSQQGDGSTRSKNNRRKIQKTPVEEAVAEENKDGEEILTETKNEVDKMNTKTGENTKARQDIVKENKSSISVVEQYAVTNKISDKTDGVVSEAKEIAKAATLPHCEEETSKVPTASLQVIEPTQKRTRRKITTSESSVENETSRTRRVDRKVQKAVIEEILIEEEHEGSSSVLNKNEDRVAENAAAVNEKDSKVLVSKDELLVNQEISTTTAETEETSKHESELVKAPTQHQESQQTVSRRRKNKPIIQEIAFEEQTTSRRCRRKAAVSTIELVTAEESEVKTPQVEAEQEGKVANVGSKVEEQVTMTTNSSPNKTVKRGKQLEVDVKKLASNEDDVSPKSGESSTEPSAKETFTKQTTKRVRQRKVDDINEGINPENTPTTVPTSYMTRRGGRHNKETAEIVASSSVYKGRNTNRNRKTPIEHITGDSQIEEISAGWNSANEILDKQPTSPSKITIPKVVDEAKDTGNIIVLDDDQNENKKSVREEEIKSVKKPVKRTYSPPDLSQAVDEKPVKQLKQEMLDVEKSDEHKQEVEKDFAIKSQKSGKRKAAAKYELQDKHYEEPTPKPRRRKVAEEDVIEPKNEDELSEVKLTEVNLAHEELFDKQISAREENQAATAKKGRAKATADERLSEEHEEPSLSMKRRALARNIEHNHDESSSAVKRRAGRRKQGGVDQEDDGEQVTPEDANKIEKTSQDQTESHKKNCDTEKESSQTKRGEAASRRRNAMKKPVENKGIQLAEENTKADNEPTDMEKKRDDDVSVENHQQQEETKRGRSRKKKVDYKEESIEPSPSHSPVAKSRARKRKEINADVNDQIPTETEQPSENIDQQTPLRTAPTAKKVLKVIEHITAESQETEDTPGRRARNVPQRKAATAYHNYDETSDSETTSKAKKKPDTPRKSLEATKKSPLATIPATPVISVSSPSPSSTITSIVTARGRTRKPTAKVQQYLEEERAKAETPKKRALLAVAAANVDGTTQQRTPAKRGRKASTIETEVERTPQTGKGRGKGKAAAIDVQTEEPSVLPAATTASTEEKNAEMVAAATTQSSTKLRVGGRKAKAADEESHNTDEPPAKKSPLELENEKQQESLPPSDHPTPTRIAGRRNAAAAAKARIEEDALAAAAIEPPKRVRAKKTTQKMSAQLVTSTDTDNPSTSKAEEVLNTKTEKEVKNKNYTADKTEHRLAPATTIEGVEGLQLDDEMETTDKSAVKKGRKQAAITTTDSPAVPTKRGRKPKIAEKVADPQTPVESKTARGRGRGRKNVHFDELEAGQQNETDVETAPVDTSEPVKRGTRTRRK